MTAEIHLGVIVPVGVETPIAGCARLLREH
jgi:hypothetical protein